MKAVLVEKRIDNQTNRWEIRAGEKGTGKVLFAGTYWPDSVKSCEARDNTISDWLRRNAVDLNW